MNLHLQSESNDPEDVMLKPWVTKKKPRKLGMSGPTVRTPVKRQRSDPLENFGLSPFRLHRRNLKEIHFDDFNDKGFIQYN